MVYRSSLEKKKLCPRFLENFDAFSCFFGGCYGLKYQKIEEIKDLGNMEYLVYLHHKPSKTNPRKKKGVFENEKAFK